MSYQPDGMIKEIMMVHRWQSFFGGKGHIVSEKMTIIDEDTAQARVDFIIEECQEYLEANRNGDIIGVLDAIMDILYFSFGMIVIHGLHNVSSAAFEIVHDCNMSKLWPGNIVKMAKNGKVLKPDTFQRPEEQLKELVERTLTNGK